MLSPGGISVHDGGYSAGESDRPTIPRRRFLETILGQAEEGLQRIEYSVAIAIGIALRP